MSSFAPLQRRLQLIKKTELDENRCVVRMSLRAQSRDGSQDGRADCSSCESDWFLSRSRSATPTEILEGFSSSLLPPSFPRGRFAAFFFLKAAPRRGFSSSAPGP